jgi:hypothetical protein
MRTDIELIKDAIDIHLHAGPSVFPRLMDAVEAANSAKNAGMRGIVIKHHHTPTVDRGYFVQKAVPEVEVLGGVVLNYSAGGLNPFAVDAALKLGGKFIWMPTVDARNHARHFGEFGKYGARLDYNKPRIYERVKGITILDEDGNLKQEVGEILDIVSKYDAVIGTSHLNISESKVLVKEAVKMDVKIVVTHVGFVTTALSFEDQKWMADRGAFLELCYSSLSPAWLCTTIEDVVENLVRVGPEHYILASDLGQIHNPSPVEGLRIYIMMLLERGLNSDQIRTMVKHNPERLLGLE